MSGTAVLREVRLYGALGREFGRVFRLAVATPAEAVRALIAVLPGFERAFIGRDGRQGYHVFVGRSALRREFTIAQGLVGLLYRHGKFAGQLAAGVQRDAPVH